jgi:hypothetical protein
MKLSMRDYYLISQALFLAIRHLRSLEEREDPYPCNGEHAEPSNRADMERLRQEVFPLYMDPIKLREQMTLASSRKDAKQP